MLVTIRSMHILIRERTKILGQVDKNRKEKKKFGGLTQRVRKIKFVLFLFVYKIRI